MQNEKEINVYWWPAEKNWNLLYNDPINLQEFLYKMKNKNKNKNSNARSMFECPAFSDKTKKTFFFTSPMSVEYEYDFTDPENSYIIPKNPLMPYLETKILRPPTINKQPLFQLSLFYCFFSEESLTASVTPPFLHNSNFTKQGIPPTGSYDIGNWLRAYPLEIMLWNEAGTFKLEKDEPLFYIEFLTDRPIKFQRVETTEKLIDYMTQCVVAPATIESRVPLITRYETFKKTRMKDLVMKEIKENTL